MHGYNDLQTVNPMLATEWNYDKNEQLTPMDVLPNSNKKVWWKCSKEHEWLAAINDRSSGTGCPICESERKTSFPEYAIIYYLDKFGMNPMHLYKEGGYELDIYIPSIKTAIEYDGHFWHKQRENEDRTKNQRCREDGITLYRIREGLPKLNDTSIDYIVREDQKDLSIIMIKMFREILGIIVDINLERDFIDITNLREFIEKQNSLLTINPTIATEWNFKRNGKLKPEYVTSNSKKKVWWKCNKGHEWKATIVNRNAGNGCPYCSNRSVLKGYNDLQTVNPLLASEWLHEKNGELTPSGVMPNSNKKVWWRCKNGHEWQATINQRNGRKTGCPYCAGQKLIPGQNDLQTTNPSLAKEWNYEKNENITPRDVMPHSNKKVWWKCGKGHEWQSTVNNRSNGSGCPECAKQRRKNKDT